MTLLNQAQVAEIARDLNGVQRKMAGEPFYIDGWHNRSFIPEAVDMRLRGLVSEQDDGDDQYTRYSYTPTPLGLAVRQHLLEGSKL